MQVPQPKPASNISRFVRDEPPAHYSFVISPLSSLQKFKMIESNEFFIIGGCKWKLILYPNGRNSKTNGEKHISLYLMIVDTKNLKRRWEITVKFKLFVFDAIKKNYLTIQDANGAVRKFDEEKTKQGFEQLISLKELKDKSKGYLVEDTCVFGAEVYVIGKCESLTMVKDPHYATLTWKIENFSKLVNNFYSSNSITVGGRKWKLSVHPKPSNVDRKYLYLYLRLTDCEKFPSNRTVYASYKLKIIDQFNKKDLQITDRPSLFSAEHDGWGTEMVITRDKLKEAAYGYIKDDAIIIKLQFLNTSIVSS